MELKSTIMYNEHYWFKYIIMLTTLSLKWVRNLIKY